MPVPVGPDARFCSDSVRSRIAAAAPAFLAQLFGERLAKRRLELARNGAADVHGAYRGTDKAPEIRGVRVNLSI